MTVRMDAEAVEAYLRAQFPQALDLGFQIDRVDEAGVCLSIFADADNLRPGGTVSGPTLMALVDSAVYILVLSRLGLQAAQAVTSSLQIHFFRRPQPGRIECVATLLKMGRRLAVGRADIEGAQGLLASATATYALPG